MLNASAVYSGAGGLDYPGKVLVLSSLGEGNIDGSIAAGEMANKGSPASAQASLCLGYCCTPWERVFLPENTPQTSPKESLFDNLRAKQADS